MSLDSNAEREAAREEYYRQCSTLIDKCHAFEEGWLAGRSQPSEWVATSERPPPDYLPVLLYLPTALDPFQAGYYFAGGDRLCAGNTSGTLENLKPVSHWQPLPKPPALLPPNTEAK